MLKMLIVLALKLLAVLWLGGMLSLTLKLDDVQSGWVGMGILIAAWFLVRRDVAAFRSAQGARPTPSEQ